MVARQVLGAVMTFAGLLSACSTPAPAGWTPGAPPELLQHVPPELRYVRVDLPPEQNGFVKWEQAFATLEPLDRTPDLGAAWKAYRENDEGYPAGEPGRLLSEYLDRNREAFARLMAAADHDRWQFPAIMKGFESDNAYLSRVKTFQDLKRLAADRDLSRGSPGAAAKSFLEILRVGTHVWEGEGALLDNLFATSLLMSAYEGMIRLAARDDLPAATLETMLVALDHRPSSREAAARAVSVDFCGFDLYSLASWERFSDASQSFSSPGTPAQAEMARRADASFRSLMEEMYRDADLPGTVRWMARFYRQWMCDLLRPWPERDRTLEDDLRRFHVSFDWDSVDARRMKVWVDDGIHTSEDLLLAKLWLLLGEPALDSGLLPRTGDDQAMDRRFFDALRRAVDRREKSPTHKADGLLLAKAMISLKAPAVRPFVETCHRSYAAREATRLLVALRLYAARKGRIPATLQDLVDAKILPAVPTDPFSGKPMRYSAERRIVWSVGPDETDDGGDGEPDSRWSGKDYVWRVPAAKN